MNVPTEGGPPPREGTGGGSAYAPRQIADLQKSITMAQIAKAAGVSQGAISSLLNDRDYGIRVSEKTRERVFKVCREMGYIPNDLRAVVRMYPELGDYCLLISTEVEGGLHDPFVHRLATAAMSAVAKRSQSLGLAFFDPQADYSAAGALPHPVRVGTFSKFLFYGQPNTSLIEALNRRGLPAVSLGHDTALPGVTSLVPDYAHAAYLAIEHLAGLGHRQLAIIAGPFGSTDSHILDLQRGVRQGLEKFGLPIEAQHIVHGDLSEQDGRKALEEIMARQPAPTALFAMSDRAALAALAQAHTSGIQIPGALSLIGCGDDLAAASTHPSLSTIHLPAEEMAELGVQEIDRLVREGAPDAPRRTVLPVRLVVRETTGPRT